MLYNEERKQRYIDYKESAVTIASGYLLRLFRASAPYEKNKGKDICNFTTSEIIEFYQMLNRQSEGSLSVINSTLSQYTNWCMMQNLVSDNQNHFLEITQDRYSECVNTLYVEKSVLTRQQVLDMVEKFENYCDKFIVLALFEGISGKDYKEIWTAHYSDIDEGKQQIRLFNGRVVNISKQLMNYAYEAGEITEYYVIGDSQRKYEFLESDDTLVKSYMNCKPNVSDHQMSRRIYNRVQRLVTSIGMEWLIPQNFIDSGKIDYVNTHSAELGISGEQYVMTKELLKNVEDQFGVKVARTVFLSRFGQFLNK